MRDAKSAGASASGEKDLFGRPVEPIRERRGRPSYAKTPENQRFVELRSAAGWTQRMIAADMGIDEDTLRKHFSVELEMGAVKVQGELLDVLMQRARQGHIPSVRTLQERLNERVAPAPRRRASTLAADEVPAQPKGKKEIALAKAQEVPGDYGDIFKARERRDH